MPFGKLKIRGFTLFLAVLLGAAVILLAESLIRSPGVQRELLERLSRNIDYQFTSGPIELSFRRGLALDARNVTIRSRDSSFVLTAEHFRFILDPAGLLRGRVVPRSFDLADAEATFTGNLIEESGLSGGFSAKAAFPPRRLPVIPPLSVRNLKVIFDDYSLFLEDLYLRTERNVIEGGGARFSAGGTLVSDGNRAAFSVGGEVSLISGKNGADLVFDLALQASGLQTGWLPDFQSLSFSDGTGSLKASARGGLSEGVDFDARLEVVNLSGSISTGEKRFPLDFPRLSFGFNGEFSDGIIDLIHVELSSPAWSFDGRAMITAGSDGAISGSAILNAPFVEYERLRDLVPVEYLPGWLSESILDRMTGGQVRVERLALQGSIDEIREFDLSATPSLFELMLTWSGINYQVVGAEVPFEDLRGSLRLSGGDLEISGVAGKFASSEVQDGYFSVTSLSSPGRYLAGLEGIFKLEDLARQRNMDFIPVSFAEVISCFESATGTASGSIHTEYITGMSGLKVLEGGFSMTDCAVAHCDLPFQVKVSRGDLVFEESGALSFEGSGKFGASAFSVHGARDGSGFFRADLEGLVDVNQLISNWYKDREVSLRLSDRVPLAGSLSFLNGQWQAQWESSLKGIGIRADGFSMALNGADDRLESSAVGVFGRFVELSAATLFVRESKLGIKGGWRSSPEDLIELSIFSEYFNPADAGLLASVTEESITVKISGNLDLAVPIRAPAESRVTGSLSVHASDFDLGGLFGYPPGGEEGAAGIELPEFFRNSEISLSLALERARWKRLVFDRIEAGARLSAGAMHVDSCTASWEYGGLEGHGWIGPGRSPEVILSGRIRMEAQPVEELLGSFDSTSGFMTGFLTMDAVFSTEGRTGNELLGGLAGSAGIAIDHGVILKSKIIFRVMERLSLQQVFRGRPEHVPREGFYFELIEAQVPFKAGVAEIEAAVMRSPVFNATAAGTVDLARRSLECDLYVHPFGAVDSLVSRIPVLGYILAGDEGALIVYRFAVSGKISDPEVQYVPIRDLGKSAAGYVKRLLLTPGRIFRALSDAARENDAPAEAESSMDRSHQ